MTQQASFTLLQSLADGLAVGATLRYVHGEVGALAATVPLEAATAGVLLEETRDLRGQGRGAFDVDVGLLGVFGHVRVGLLARNLTRPSFGAADGERVEIGRQVRAGFGVRPNGRLLIAIDADLTANRDALGDERRRVALGAEGVLGRRLAVRGGVRIYADGPAMPVPAAGFSVAVRPTLWVDAQATLGNRQNGRGWGLSARLSY